MLKNLKAKAISRKPNTTFTELSQPPDLGSVLNQLGKKANKVNGIAKAKEKPNIPTIGLINSPPAEETKMLPTIGPVQENETNTMVKAIKNTPISPPLSACLSAAFTKELGKVISKSPRKDKPKIMNTAKKIRLGIHSVER